MNLSAVYGPADPTHHERVAADLAALASLERERRRSRATAAWARRRAWVAAHLRTVRAA